MFPSQYTRVFDAKPKFPSFPAMTWPVVQRAHVNIGAILHHNYFHIRLFDAKPKLPCFPARTWPVVQGAHMNIGAILEHDY